MHAKLPVLLLASAAALSGAVSCGGSSGGSQANAAPSTTSQHSTATSSEPGHGDLRKVEELEQYVEDQWNKAFADPTDANYAEGVKVKTVKCVPKKGTTRSDCTVTPTKGDAKTFTYLVSEDGQSAERFSPGV
jgi:hypothetical protein